ncbi:hypothetical protein KSP39_PZI018102 [Platanthera zijinensis]|uniref:CCHC-type domain-containing protein n=1 Tax=Platanthera zijinensis TaxID=2320716 RepID=A0AAP0B3G3_9ASPA
MGDEARYKVEKFSGTKFAFWKMQIEDLLIALGTIQLTIASASSVAFNTENEKTMMDLMATLTRMYEKPSTSNKVFLMKRLFNMRMVDRSLVAEHFNSFNTITNQLSSVDLKFDDEIRALLLLSSLPDSWDSLVTAVSNSSGNAKLVFDDIMRLVLNEEVRKRSSDEASSSALNFEARGRGLDRSTDRGRSKSKRGKSNTPKGKIECWNCGKKGHMKMDCHAPEKAICKHQEKDSSTNIPRDNIQDALILSLDNTKSWIVDSDASFHASPNKSNMNFVQGYLGKVATVSGVDACVWHHRLGHMSEEGM